MSKDEEIEKQLKGFSRRFKEAFNEAKNADIAKRMGKSDAAIKNYAENRVPAPDVLILISDLTNVSIHWLLTGKGAKCVVQDEEAMPRFDDATKEILKGLADKNNERFSDIIKELVLKQLTTMQLISEQGQEPVTIEYYGGNFIEIPLLGEIAADKPFHNFKENKTVRIAPTFDMKDKEIFALQVRGDSFEDDDLRDGDLIICERSNMALNGDRVFALVDEKVAIKRYKKEGGKIILQPLNSTIPTAPLNITRVQIRAIVRGVQRG